MQGCSKMALCNRPSTCNLLRIHSSKLVCVRNLSIPNLRLLASPFIQGATTFFASIPPPLLMLLHWSIILNCFFSKQHFLTTFSDTSLYSVWSNFLFDFCQVLSSPHLDKDGKIADFCDGEIFQRHAIFSAHPSALQLFLYYDDFEVTNPLTSKTIVMGKRSIYCYFVSV